MLTLLSVNTIFIILTLTDTFLSVNELPNNLDNSKNVTYIYIKNKQKTMGIFSDMFNVWATSRQNKKQNQWNKQQADIKYQRDQEMWNKANEYNSPGQQMLRYKQAGLNENLIYGQGSPGLTSNALPQYNAPEGEFKLPQVNTSAMPLLSQYQDIKNTIQQRDNLKAQEEYTRTQNNIGLISLADATAKYNANSPYYPELAKYGRNYAYNNANQKAYDSQVASNKATLSNYLMDNGWLANQKLQMNNDLAMKSSKLLSYNLDNAILEQKKSLGEWQTYWMNKSKGLTSNPLKSGLDILDSVGGLKNPFRKPEPKTTGTKSIRTDHLGRNTYVDTFKY